MHCPSDFTVDISNISGDVDINTSNAIKKPHADDTNQYPLPSLCKDMDFGEDMLTNKVKFDDSKNSRMSPVQISKKKKEYVIRKPPHNIVREVPSEEHFDELELPGIGQDHGSVDDFEDTEYVSDDEYDEEDIPLTNDEIERRKRDGLANLRKLTIKGFESDRKFTMAHTLEEIEEEVKRLDDVKDLDRGLKWYRKITMFGANLMEWVEKRYNFFGLKLDGWAESLYESIDEFDDIFEELHDKYKGVVKIPPEIKLMGMFFGSAYMFHASQVNNQEEFQKKIFSRNPTLKEMYQKELADVMQEEMTQQNPYNGGQQSNATSMLGAVLGGGGGGGVLNSLLGGFGGNVQNRKRTTSPVSSLGDDMSGPEDDDDILNNLADEQDMSDIESLSELETRETSHNI